MKRVFLVLLLIAAGGCAVTEAQKPKAGDSLATSGFLTNSSQLQPGTKDQAALVYFNPNAKWAHYNSIMIEPVTIGLGPDHPVSDADEQMLSSYYYNALSQNLSKDFTVVNQPGPGVLKIRVALTDATTATPVLRTISVVVPQARLLNSVTNLATGSYAFVGSAQSEGEVLDSVTGERLAAAIDKRSGGLSVKNADVWQWGDAQNAMDYWAQRTAQRLSDLRAGKTEVSQQ
jgi:hypothetical protein